jgi:hypothetical protein
VRQPVEVGASSRRQVDHAVTLASARDVGGLWQRTLLRFLVNGCAAGLLVDLTRTA